MSEPLDTSTTDLDLALSRLYRVSAERDRLSEEVKRLTEEARRWYRADGTSEVLATAEEVVGRRKAAAAEIDRLRAMAKDDVGNLVESYASAYRRADRAEAVAAHMRSQWTSTLADLMARTWPQQPLSRERSVALAEARVSGALASFYSQLDA